MRKLATIRTIKSIEPIPGADRIEVATVGGWKTVVKKGEFRAGDLCVFFEIDSFLPAQERYSFLGSSCWRSSPELGDGYRLKTTKLRGVVSQGLALPLDEFPELTLFAVDGKDVTELLGVKKYEKPLPVQLSGFARGNFPSFIPKTDQERAQNLMDEIAKSRESSELFEVSMKLDGSSMTVYRDEHGYIGVCSRNLDLRETAENTFWRVAHSSGVIEYLKKADRAIAFQGELMGPGVQGNREKLASHEFYVFDIFLIDEQRYLKSPARLTALTQAGLKSVPVLYYTDAVPTTIDGLMELARGKSVNNPVREGLVFKSLETDFSFKVISNEFLLCT
jgi:RNA ligase (TIGR02306 family)